MKETLHKIALVTGASNGVGFHTALLLARMGCKVYALSRNIERLNVLKDEIGQEGMIFPIQFDLSSDDPGKLLQQIESEDGRLDILIHNAGYLKHAPFVDLQMEDWEYLYKVNVIAPARISAVLLELMKKSEKAHIVHISSMGGIQGSVKFPGLSAYSSSKGALCILTECMAEELKETNISVNCLALGAVQTEMLSQAFPGYIAAMGPEEMGRYIADFAMNGHTFYNGKVLPVSISTP